MESLFASPLIQAGIGMLTIWFVLAMVCSGLVQLVASAAGFRANNLWQSLATNLSSPSDPRPAEGTGHKKRSDPVGLQALKLLVRPELRPGETISYFVSALPRVEDNSIKRISSIEREAAATALMKAIGRAPEPGADAKTRQEQFAKTPLGLDVAGLEPNLQNDDQRLRLWFIVWFDDQSVRLQRSYRRKIRWWAALAAVIVIGVTGLNSLDVADSLYTQPTRRTLLLAQAQQIDGETEASLCPSAGPATRSDPAKCTDAAAASISSLGSPFWREKAPASARGWLLLLVGVGLSLGACIAGAPFWYDVLKRFMGIKTIATNPLSPTAIVSSVTNPP